MGNKNAAAKVKTVKVKKPRKERAKIRSRKDSVAGHFADKLRNYSKQANDVMRKIEKFPGIAEAEGTTAIIGVLDSLASQGWTPPRGKGGRTAVTFAPGQKVTVAPECVSMLKTLFVAAGIDGAEFYVSESYSPQPKDKQLPLRVGGGDLDKPAVGFVSRKFIS